ncbi:protein kinase domain-containing protein [Kitasatospora xanthocidica]|uniref:protein kinase domain-containing protein n=1 Tax=Kitasatospora xanthocidica TaxID=83382 RepID=UPI0016783517|nr:protein kinase [Kitasatospora xanthocidica]
MAGGGVEIGSVVGGRYRIEAGGAGEVRYARDTASGRPVAVKTPARAPGPAVRLRHPGIVTVLDAGEHEGRPFLVMERLDGYTLDDHLLDGGYRAAQVAEFGAQVAEALAVAHRAGMTHGGIDPARLLLTPAGVVKILGFGTLAPARTPDLSALGATLHQLLAHPAPPGPPDGLGALLSELRDAPPESDPRLTEEFAARLRRLAQEPAEPEPTEAAEAAEQAERPWQQRLLLEWVPAVVICAGLLAVTAYAIAVTV